MQCPQCNTDWPDELAGKLKFCGACGAPLLSASTLTWQPKPASTAGELRFVSIIFADLAGFTSYAEDRSPDEVARVMGDFLQRLTKAIEQYNGTVYQYLGDAIVATFGLPRPDPNAARNAVRAGLKMQQVALDFSKEYQLDFQLRVGIHAGEVMYQAIGGSWAILGDTVNTANRIQTAASPGTVWVSRPVYEEIRRYFTTVVRPAVELKGKKQAVQPYEVSAERRIPITNLPAFVGRAREWQQIQDALADSVKNQTLRTVVIRGAAGVGKSRLVWELRDWVQRQQKLYRIDAIQYDHSERLPSHGLNALIRSRFELALVLGEDEIVSRLHEQMNAANLDAEQKELAIEFFAFILGVSHPDFRIQSMDGKSKWEGAFVEMKTWLERRAREAPLVWILEDVQKGDADTAAFLDWAIRLNWSAPVLVILTIREEDFSPTGYFSAPVGRWLKEGLASEIRLKEIQPVLLAQALTTMVDNDISEAIALRIAEHTEGNPLFATELILYLKERGLLSDMPALEHVVLPHSVREVMEARIERLGYEGKEVAKRGALMGRRFTSEGVGRIWELPHSEMEQGLDVLRETETIYEESSKLFAGEIEEVFRHGRLQEAALARIPREERLRWLDELETWVRAKLNDLGSQWEGAGALFIPLIARAREEHQDDAQASLWHETLGLLHRKYHRNQEAAQAFRKALSSAGGIRRLILGRECAEAEMFSGEMEKALNTIDEAKETTGLPSTEVPSDLLPRLIALTDDAMSLPQMINLSEAEILLELTRANALMQYARIPEAEKVYRQIETRLMEIEGANIPRLWMRWGKAWSYFQGQILGNTQEAQKTCESIRQRVNLQDPALEEERMLFAAAETDAAMNLGDYDKSEASNNERLKIAQSRHNLSQESSAWIMRGLIAQGRGDLVTTSEHYEKSLAISRSIGYRRGEAITLHNQAENFTDRGLLDLAIQYEEQYLALSRATGNRLAEAYAPSTLGVIAAEKGEYDQAETYIRHSLQIAEENGWPLLVEMGKLYLANLMLFRWFDQRNPEFLSQAMQQYEILESTPPTERHGEFYACLILVLFLSGHQKRATAMLKRVRQEASESWVTDRIWLDFAEAIVKHQPWDKPLSWFREHGFQRAVNFVEQVTRVIEQG